MKQNNFYEVDGCTDFIPVKLIEEHEYLVNALKVELTETGLIFFVPNMYSFPKVDEPQKVTVPKFVAEWIEECKSKGVYLCAAMSNDDNKTFYWLDTKEKQDIFARAWLDGYKIEQEKLYTVEIPNPNRAQAYALFRGSKGTLIIIGTSFNYKEKKEYKLTEAEIKKDFEWAWDAGFAKEVE